MKKKGFTLVEIMIVVAIIALLATIAIPGLLRVRISANESAAQASLKTISTAIESYAAANNGLYPTAETALTGATPPYLNKSFSACTSAAPCQGYVFTYPTISATAYCAQAVPANAGTSGNKTFSISTGSVLTEAACA